MKTAFTTKADPMPSLLDKTLIGTLAELQKCPVFGCFFSALSDRSIWDSAHI